MGTDTRSQIRKLWYNTNSKKWVDFKPVRPSDMHPDAGGVHIHDWSVIVSPKLYGVSKKDVDPYRRFVTMERSAQFEIPQIGKLMANKGWVRVVFWMRPGGLDLRAKDQKAVFATTKAYEKKFPSDFINRIVLELEGKKLTKAQSVLKGQKLSMFLRSGQIGTQSKVAQFRSRFEDMEKIMSNKKLTFSEVLALNEAMADLEEGPQFQWAEGSGEVEALDLDLPQRLIEAEAELMNRFRDDKLSDEAYKQVAAELVELLDEAVAMRPGTLNIQKGDWVRLKNDTLAKVVDMTSGQSVLKVKNNSGRITFVKKTLLARIGKYKGKPAFGFISPRSD